MAIRVAINGFGRIGRAFLRIVEKNPEVEVVAINDLSDVENLAYLLKYDSAYGQAPFVVGTRKDDWRTLLTVNGRDVAVYKEKDPAALPWRDLAIDVVVEATGAFCEYGKAKLHLDAGAKRVVITAPVKGEPSEVGIVGGTVLMGVNDDQLATCDISSNGSCTTNAVSPIIEILHETIGIEKAMLNTIHAYTATQAIVDVPDAKEWRRGRAGAHNIIPSSTGAATALTKVVTDLQGKFDGIAMRVPVISGSVADVTFISKRPTSVEEVNGVLRLAAEDERWKPVFSASSEELVSSDILGSQYASIADLTMTRVVDGTLVKVCAWYDNEMGYTQSLVHHVLKTGSFSQNKKV
ncbi:MAG: Glyceraldehyde-3-phosphate dehydrogenase, type I [Parcubacteria group bacterium GW2011_GWD2_42_14]|nr:MAG: Glyceraldehyde-3-phosphate dehydrogenase, type I [Parcubacteria group bacterium GW2011_GWD2_42_14]